MQYTLPVLPVMCTGMARSVLVVVFSSVSACPRATPARKGGWVILPQNVCTVPEVRYIPIEERKKMEIEK